MVPGRRNGNSLRHLERAHEVSRNWRRGSARKIRDALGKRARTPSRQTHCLDFSTQDLRSSDEHQLPPGHDGHSKREYTTDAHAGATKNKKPTKRGTDSVDTIRYQPSETTEPTSTPKPRTTACPRRATLNKKKYENDHEKRPEFDTEIGRFATIWGRVKSNSNLSECWPMMRMDCRNWKGGHRCE